jgi:hypothetical protein
MAAVRVPVKGWCVPCAFGAVMNIWRLRPEDEWVGSMALKYSADLGRLSRIRDGLALRLRRRIFDLFMREIAPSPHSLVADFGVTGHQSHPAHYFFEMLYPYKDRLTVLGRESEGARWYSEQFPGLTYIECDLREIPLPDLHFEAGICNAVVEHAGTWEQQAALVREVCRVCKCVMFTTPNARFPVDPHTLVPFAHWLPGPAHRAVLRGLGLRHFADVEVLHPLTSREFVALFPSSRQNRLMRIGFPLLPTNLVCISSL